jgi:hypothetical protein
LRRVNASEKRDRSAAAVPGGASDTPAASTPGAGPGGGGLADALQGALAKRKQKVSGSGMYFFLDSLFYGLLTVGQTTRRMTMMTGNANRLYIYLYYQTSTATPVVGPLLVPGQTRVHILDPSIPLISMFKCCNSSM